MKYADFADFNDFWTCMHFLVASQIRVRANFDHSWRLIVFNCFDLASRFKIRTCHCYLNQYLLNLALDCKRQDIIAIILRLSGQLSIRSTVEMPMHLKNTRVMSKCLATTSMDVEDRTTFFRWCSVNDTSHFNSKILQSTLPVNSTSISIRMYDYYIASFIFT